MAEIEHTRDVFRASDQEIPLLAAQAALELDLLEKRLGKSVEHVNKLADYFADVHEPLSEFYDPVTSGVISRALCAYFALDFESLADFDMHNREIGEELRKAAQGDVEIPAARLRDFCLAISQFSSASQSNVYGNRERHPFRK